jgi:hypothetical protein
MLSPHTQNNKKKNYTTLIQGKKKRWEQVQISR